MAPNDIIVTLSSLITIGFLFYGYFWLYHEQRIDVVRQKFFKIRDDLFDEAIAGNISFDDDAYKLLRETLNGSIRFAHKIDIWHLLAYNLFLKRKLDRSSDSFTEKLQNAMQQLDDEKKNLVGRYLFEMNKTMVFHLFMANLALCLFVLLPWFVFKWVIVKFKGNITEFVVRVLNTPLIKSQTEIMDDSMFIAQLSFVPGGRSFKARPA